MIEQTMIAQVQGMLYVRVAPSFLRIEKRKLLITQLEYTPCDNIPSTELKYWLKSPIFLPHFLSNSDTTTDHPFGEPYIPLLKMTAMFKKFQHKYRMNPFYWPTEAKGVYWSYKIKHPYKEELGQKDLCFFTDKWQKNFSAKNLGEKGKKIARKKGWKMPTNKSSQKEDPPILKQPMTATFLCAQHIHSLLKEQ